jgi:NADH-quinone oxidoreductase subunit N
MTDISTIQLLLPEITLVAAATLIYLLGAFKPLRNTATFLAIAAIVIAAAFLFGQHQLIESSSADGGKPVSVANGPLVLDLFGYTARWGILTVGSIVVLLSSQRGTAPQASEQAGSILLMLAGLMLVAAGNELTLIFAGLELVSIPTYIVLYVGRHDARGQEAASKYFFLSILSSAVLLYGFSFLYGVSGSTQLGQIAASVTPKSSPDGAANWATTLVPLAMLLIFGGLAFRLTAVPFHFYAPDVYQGTSNSNAGLLSTLPKIAGLTAMARIILAALPGWESLGWKVSLVIAVLTMTFGNILALWQTNIRRMLAYSSIAHAGYLLIGISVALAARTITPASAVANEAAIKLNGLGTSVFYLASYIFATLGAFAALAYLSDGSRQVSTLDGIAGLNRRHPVIALSIAVFMFSLAGVPPMVGFWGKFTLVMGALTLDETRSLGGAVLQPWFVGLAVVTVLNAAIGAAYYLRVIGAMYFRSSEETQPVLRPITGPLFATAICAVLVIGLGLMPRHLMDASNRAGESIGRPPMVSQPSGIQQVAAIDSPK